MAEIGTTRRYHKPEREIHKREIRRMLIEESLSGRQICERLNLPERTLRRYLSEIYKDDNELLIAPSREEMATYANILIEQLTMQRKEVLEDIVRKEGADVYDKLAGHNLAAELSRQVFFLRIQAPAGLARHLPAVLTTENKMIESQRGLHIKIAKQNAKQLSSSNDLHDQYPPAVEDEHTWGTTNQ